MADSWLREDLFAEKFLFHLDGKLYFDPECRQSWELKSNSSLRKRIQHYVKWTTKRQMGIFFDLFLFPEQGSPQVLVRRAYLEPVEENRHRITFFAASNLGESIFGKSLSLLDNVQDAVLVAEAEPLDEPGPRVLYANRAFETETGFKQSDIVGKTPRILQGPESSIEAKQKIREGLKRWQVVKQEVTNYTKTGQAFTVELNISPVADASGWWTHWVSFQRNVTKKVVFE